MKLITNKTLAYDSADYKEPFGIKYNNTGNHKFNECLYQLFDRKIKILDLGCAGGLFIKECIEDGHIAAGIDGSDYRKINNLPEWNIIPNNLYTADITSSFFFLDDDETRVKFDVITAWEVMEHLSKKDLPVFFNNLELNLADKGFIFVSINVASKAHSKIIFDNGDWGEGKHHQNVETPDWWDSYIDGVGFKNDFKTLSLFNNEFIRGPGRGCDEYATEHRLKTTNIVKEQWATINRCWVKK